MIEQPTIRKSTFKVSSVNELHYSGNKYKYGEQYFKNCFISPDGYITVVDKEWHHVEKALEIIKRMDKNLQDDIDKYKSQVEFYTDRLKKKLDGWDRKYCLEWLGKYQEKLDKAVQPHVEQDFINANRNRGLDAGEFLIIHYGYVALSDFNIMYLSTTRDQRITLNCYSTIEDGSEILIPMNKEQLKFKNEREKIIYQIKTAIKEKCYYEDSSNSFHCPSGIPRMGWESSKRRALSDYRKIDNPSFRAKAAEYGIQWPKVKHSYFGYHHRVEIDDNSMIIPGFKHDLMVRQ